MMIESRKEREREFHDQREAVRRDNQDTHDSYYTNRRFYAICNRSRQYLASSIRERCAGKTVLDFCCGTGTLSLEVAKMGARVVGVDISPKSIETATARVKAAGLSDRAQFHVMDAENLEFPDGSFDLIVESGVLHHLDLGNAYRELARVLTPTGEVVCHEALAHNFLIHQYRRRTLHLRTAWEVDHILRVEDIHRSKDYFGRLDVRFFHLASLAAIALVGRPGFTPLLTVLDAVDDVLLRVPGIQRQAWQAIFILSEPKKQA